MREIPADPSLDGLKDLFPSQGAPAFVAAAAGEMLGETLDPDAAEVEYIRYWPNKGCVVLWAFGRSGKLPQLVSGRLFRGNEGDRLVRGPSFSRQAERAVATSELSDPPYRLLPDRQLLLMPFPMDGLLPGLPAAHTERWARDVLAPAVGLEPDSVTRVESRPVSFKPWRRCVYHYRLHANGKAHGFFAKVFRDERGEQFFEWATAARRELLRAGVPWETPRVLAYIPSEKVLVFEELEGSIEISDLLHDARHDAKARCQLLDAIERAGEAIGQLREIEIPATSSVPPDKIIANVRKRTRGIAKAAPEFARTLTRELDLLAEEALHLDPEPLVQSHAAFRHDQLVLHDGGLAILDLDGLCLSGRSADAGYFLGSLDVVAARRPRQREMIGHCEEAFLRGLHRRGGASPEWLAWYRAAAQVKKCIRNFLSLDRKWPAAAAALENGLVEETLARGGRAA